MWDNTLQSWERLGHQFSDFLSAKSTSRTVFVTKGILKSLVSLNSFRRFSIDTYHSLQHVQATKYNKSHSQSFLRMKHHWTCGASPIRCWWSIAYRCACMRCIDFFWLLIIFGNLASILSAHANGGRIRMEWNPITGHFLPELSIGTVQLHVNIYDYTMNDVSSKNMTLWCEGVKLTMLTDILICLNMNVGHGHRFSNKKHILFFYQAIYLSLIFRFHCRDILEWLVIESELWLIDD